MPDFGAPVAQNVQGPQAGLKTISDIMGLRQQQQALQSGALGIRQQQQNLTRSAVETQGVQQTQSQRQGIANIDWSKYDDGTGTVSTDKMLGDDSLRKAAGDQFLDVVGKAAMMRTQQLQNKQSLVNLNDGLRNQFGAVVGALRTDPDVVADNPTGRQKVRDAMAQFGQAGGPDAARVASIYSPVADHAPPGKLARGISAIQLQAMDASRQASAQSPQYTDTGSTLVNTNPQAAGGNLGASPAITKQLPPTTQVIDPSTGQPGLIGPHDSPTQPGDTPSGIDEQIRMIRSNGGQPIDPADQPAMDREVTRLEAKKATLLAGAPHFTPTGLPPGQTGNIENNFQEMNRHFASLNDQSSGAALTTGLAGNIKALAPGAATGTESGRKAYVAGLLNAMGLGTKATGDLQKDTDLLEKNMAQLNLATPASSDAARMLVSAARPHGTMSGSAIGEAADQLVGQVKANMAMRNALSGYKTMGDVQGYTAARQKLESIADPRVWQYESMGPGTATAKAFLSKLQPVDRQALIKKAGQLEQMGLLK